MGRWGGRRGGRGGGGGGGNAPRPTEMASCRGHGVVMGTCDSARERETAVELSRLLNVAIEDLESAGALSTAAAGAGGAGSGGADDDQPQSVAALIAAEVRAAKTSQHITSVHTSTKGLVMLKISAALTAQGLTPVQLIEAVFRRIERTKESSSKYTCRLIPLEFVFFPNESELQASLRKCLRAAFPDVALPALVCRRHLAAARDRAKAAKKVEAAERKRKRHEAYLAKQQELQGGGGGGGDGDGDGPAKKVKVEGGEGGGGESAPPEAPAREAEAPEAAGTGGEQAPADGVKKQPDQNDNDDNDNENEDNDNDDGEGEDEDEDESPGTIIGSKDEPPPDHPTRAYPPFSYCLSFAARNHNVLTKTATLALSTANMPAEARPDYKASEYTLTVEILKNTGGVTLVPTALLDELCGFNLRKFTALHCPDAAAASSAASGAAAAGAAARAAAAVSSYGPAAACSAAAGSAAVSGAAASGSADSAAVGASSE